VTTLISAAKRGVGEVFIISSKDYPGCTALATIGFTAVRPTFPAACLHIQDSDEC